MTEPERPDPMESPATPSGSPETSPQAGETKTAQTGARGQTAAGRPGGDASADIVVTEDTIGIDLPTKPPVKERGLVVELVKEEVIRAAVALLLIAIFGLVIIAAFLNVSTWANTKQLLDSIVPAITGLLGSALGFYFGKK